MIFRGIHHGGLVNRSIVALNRKVTTRVNLGLSTLGLGIALAIAGCSDGRPPRVPVKGQVLIDGKPLHTGGVRFTPVNGRPSSGAIDNEGRFSLSTFEPGDGCTLGKHIVTVVAVEELGGNARRWHIPKRYTSASTSGLSQEIEGANETVRIELTWAGEKGPFVERSYGE